MKYAQVIIVGGGLAGLTAAIHLSRKNIKTILLEKEKYPHHKVCGEYLSREVLPYLKTLNIDIETLKAQEISRFNFSSQSGKIISTKLTLGGLGISRFNLDNHLFKKAVEAGCEILEETVTEIKFENDDFTVSTSEGKKLKADFVLGAYGKRSNIDKYLQRKFIQETSGWLAVKAHYNTGYYPDNLVSLHNFNGGYCGLSKTETGAVNVCYLASYKSFKAYKNTKDYREKVLMKNPHLNSFFSNAEMTLKNELTIAQISFNKKSLIEDHVLMLGDAAGLIHPLCGNGMAMAIHSSKIAAESLLSFYENKISRLEVENMYKKGWKFHFNSRLRSGRFLQKLLLNPDFSRISQNIVSKIPGIIPHIIKRTHGRPIHD